MAKNKKLILNDYQTVAELIKLAQKAKKKIEVKRMGDDYVGVYYEVKIYGQHILRR